MLVSIPPYLSVAHSSWDFEGKEQRLMIFDRHANFEVGMGMGRGIFGAEDTMDTVGRNKNHMEYIQNQPRRLIMPQISIKEYVDPFMQGQE